MPTSNATPESSTIPLLEAKETSRRSLLFCKGELKSICDALKVPTILAAVGSIPVSCVPSPIKADAEI